MRFITFLMTMTLHSWKGVLAYGLAISLGAFAVAMGLLALLFGPEATPIDYRRAAIIVLSIAPPFGFFGGWHLLRITKLSDELARLVNRDRLTNVATRDFFFAQMRDKPEAFGISLMIDIDKFKSVNDTYGHLAGDAVIASVARTLTRNVRERDIVCRFGGEEFMVFLYDENVKNGFAIAERMRKAVEREALEFDGMILRATVSIGGSLKDHITDIEEAINTADQALLRAKSSGRNRTIFADDMPVAPTVMIAAAD